MSDWNAKISLSIKKWGSLIKGQIQRNLQYAWFSGC